VDPTLYFMENLLAATRNVAIGLSRCSKSMQLGRPSGRLFLTPGLPKMIYTLGQT
jgi:hypothetical protein